MRTNWIKAFSAAAIVTVSVLFALVAVEMYARYAKPTAYQNDKELGWKLLPNANITVDNLRLDQTEYKALITTNELGLRESGGKATRSLRYSFLGFIYCRPIRGQ
jgi:hypothetical protein